MHSKCRAIQSVWLALGKVSTKCILNVNRLDLSSFSCLNKTIPTETSENTGAIFFEERTFISPVIHCTGFRKVDLDSRAD